MSSMTFRMLVLIALVAAGLVAAPPAMAANVELLHGTVRAAGHDAAGRAAVVQIDGGRRVLTLRRFRIDPGPQVRVYLVPRAGAKSDGAVRRDFKDLGKLKGNRGNQQYTIPRSVDLRRYNSVVFWCVPFTRSSRGRTSSGHDRAEAPRDPGRRRDARGRRLVLVGRRRAGLLERDRARHAVVRRLQRAVRPHRQGAAGAAPAAARHLFDL